MPRLRQLIILPMLLIALAIAATAATDKICTDSKIRIQTTNPSDYNCAQILSMQDGSGPNDDSFFPSHWTTFCNQECCNPGNNYCNNANSCVNFQSDGNNCGSCNTKCAASQTCFSAQCENNCANPGDKLAISGTNYDSVGCRPSVLGASGITKTTTDQSSPNYYYCNNPSSCYYCSNSNHDFCLNLCTDLKEDEQNCGACQNSCNPDQICSSSSCTCAIGSWNPSKGRCCEATETCNDGFDNNCNGNVDENCACIDDERKYCYTGPKGTEYVGICKPGLQVCSSNLWGACTGEVLPQIEVQNGLDDDCDGVVDEGNVCSDGQSQVCYTGPQSTLGIGSCRAGTQACVLGYWPNTCSGEITPSKEVCDGLDNNCDGSIDEGIPLTTYYFDWDGDGYGDISNTIRSCRATAGYVANHDDCNDKNPAINPGAAEVCGDNIDNNCNNSPDDGCACSPEGATRVCGKSVGICNDGTQTCRLGLWSVCENAVTPKPEVCDYVDNNCNGIIDEGVTSIYYDDNDNDGFGNPLARYEICAIDGAGKSTNNRDCNDNNPNINPNSNEICADNIDNDCSGIADDGCPDECTANERKPCTFPAGIITNPPSICRPGEASCINGKWSAICEGRVEPTNEFCDNVLDENCDGLVDNGVKKRFYLDSDGDGKGNPEVELLACGISLGYVQDSTDCDDSDNTIYSGAPELCDKKDNNCNGQIDENLVQIMYYKDADGDGIGNTLLPILTCGSVPQGYVSSYGDCNDNNANVKPGAAELCDGFDNNCNGAADEGCQCTETLSKSCGFNNVGECRLGVQNCVSGKWGSCIGAVMPTTEVCNAKDDNCNGAVDEFVSKTYYKDSDSDTYGDPKSMINSCLATPPLTFTTDARDCNDLDQNSNPAAPETCSDGKDNNCNGAIDEGCGCINGQERACGVSNIGECRLGTQTCREGSWGNCIGQKKPTAEICDDKDNNCDGLIDNINQQNDMKLTYYLDSDSDTYGSQASSVLICPNPAGPLGYVLDKTDCNDNNNRFYPGAPEVCGTKQNENCRGIMPDDVNQDICSCPYDGKIIMHRKGVEDTLYNVKSISPSYNIDLPVQFALSLARQYNFQGRMKEFLSDNTKVSSISAQIETKRNDIFAPLPKNNCESCKQQVDMVCICLHSKLNGEKIDKVCSNFLTNKITSPQAYYDYLCKPNPDLKAKATANGMVEFITKIGIDRNMPWECFAKDIIINYNETEESLKEQWDEQCRKRIEGCTPYYTYNVKGYSIKYLENLGSTNSPKECYVSSQVSTPDDIDGFKTQVINRLKLLSTEQLTAIADPTTNLDPSKMKIRVIEEDKTDVMCVTPSAKTPPAGKTYTRCVYGLEEYDHEDPIAGIDINNDGVMLKCYADK